jgi:iron complex transport system ATP-binding protein
LAAEVADRLLLLDSGRVRALGPPEHVLNEATLETVYGCPVHVGTNPKTGRPTVQVLWPEGEEVGI